MTHRVVATIAIDCSSEENAQRMRETVERWLKEVKFRDDRFKVSNVLVVALQQTKQEEERF